MTKINRKKLSLFKTNLEILMDYGLEFDIDGEIDEQIYTEKDVLRASHILMHTAGNISIANMIKKGLSEKDMIEKSEEMGKDLRTFIKTYTDLDTKDLANNMITK